MPQAPYALLRASINGAAVQTGGITVPASATIQLSADPSASVGVNQYKYEIYGYPVGFACPGGWSTDSASVYYYTGGATPPVFSLPTIANWGKFMLRLTVNNGISINLKTIPASQLIDNSTALSMLSQNGLADVGLYETNQFATTWVPPVQASLRAVDSAVSAVSGANSKPPARLVSISNIASLSGEQTIDSVLTSASRVLLTGQTTTSQNGLWVTSSGAWSRPTDFSTDTQVVVGQTVYITAGSVYGNTNWQLTSGSSIAGAKTYGQLAASSVGAIAPVNALSTSNTSLSGTTAIDGVTLTANASRVLSVAQTTSSQNGPWLVQSGSWTRPSDFNVDAQVIPGQSVFVKPGGTSIPPEGQTWLLVSGSTIAGAKTYSKPAVSGKLAPIRAIQTAALPTFITTTTALTASANGALSTTVFDSVASYAVGDRYEVNSLGIASVANGIYALTQIGSASLPWVLTRVSELDSSADFVGGASYEVLDGISPNKGSNRALFTPGVISLGTTPLSFGAVREKAVLRVDLSQPPYNVKDFADAGSWAASGAADHFRGIDKFLWDYQNIPARGELPSANGGIIFGHEPFDHYGTCTLAGAGQNVSILNSFSAQGGHMAVATTMANDPSKDGFPKIGPTVDTASQATSLSSITNGSNETVVGGNATRQFYYNLNDAGLFFKDWTQFEYRMLIRFSGLGASTTPASYNDPFGHIISCRGRRMVEDTGDTPTPFGGCPFAITFGNSDPCAIAASMRLTDPNAGVYATGGGITHTGGGAGTVTGDTLVQPTEDAPDMTIRIEASGTAGTPGVSVSWAVDGIKFCAPVALGTATNLAMVHYNNVVYTGRLAPANLAATGNVATLSGEQTIDGTMTGSSRVVLSLQTTTSQNGVWRTQSGAWTREGDYNSDATIAGALHYSINVVGGTANNGYDYVFASGTTLAGAKTIKRAKTVGPDCNAQDQPFTAMFNFSGALVKGDTYKIPCSGVNQTVTVTSSTAVTINTNYDVCLQYRGGKVYLYVSVAGGTLDAGASATTGVSATGVLRQRWWETTCLGRPNNANVWDLNNDYNEWQGWLGSFRILSSNVVALTSSVTTLYGGSPAHAVPGQEMVFVPGTDTVMYDVPGTKRRRYRSQTSSGHGYTYIIPRSQITGVQFGEGGFEGLTFLNGSDVSNRGSGLLTMAWRGHVFRDIRFSGGLYGWSSVGPDFGSINHDISWGTKWGDGIIYSQGQLTLSGRQNFVNCGGPCDMTIFAANVSFPGLLFANGEDTTRCIGRLINVLGGSIANLSCDMENQILHSVGRSIFRISVGDGYTFEMSGGAFSAETYAVIEQVGGASTKGQISLRNFQVLGGNQWSPFSSRGTAPPFRIANVTYNEGFDVAVPMCDVPGKWLESGVTGRSVLTDANATLTWVEGTVFYAAPSTWSANRTLTLSPIGMRLGRYFDLLIEAQPSTYTTTIVNGGPAGGTIHVVPAATDRKLRFRMDESFNLVRV